MELGNITERDHGETCGAWKRPEWQPDIKWFKCKGCKSIVPESLFHASNPTLELCGYCDKHLVVAR